MKNKEILSRLIRSEFDKYTDPLPHESEVQEGLIELALEYGLKELAKEMQKDL